MWSSNKKDAGKPVTDLRVAKSVGNTAHMICKAIGLLLVTPYFLAFHYFREIGPRQSLLFNVRLMIAGLGQALLGAALPWIAYKLFMLLTG